jgi:hypothetical protein
LLVAFTLFLIIISHWLYSDLQTTGAYCV